MHSHKILKLAKPHLSLQNNFAKELGISRTLAQVLINRGINTLAQAQNYLKPDISGMHDPFEFSQMSKAVGLVKKACQNHDRVLVFGDYDVDGITSTVLAKSVLTKMGLEVLHHLPHRVNEGYGLNFSAVNFARENNVKLVVTADCGTSSHKEIGALRQANIDVVVTDHHEPQDLSLPAASSMINPKLKNSGYAYRDLAGVGVVYKFAQALSGSSLIEELDLVTLGTVADSVPLTGENRIIVKEGIARFSTTQRPGLRALMDKAGISDKKFSATYISFIIAPRLNASGRMSSAETSLKLLMSAERAQADTLAAELEAFNRQRQKEEARILKEAEELINAEINFKDHKVIVIAKEDWHHGVLGIVASKLADRFYRPAIVISLSGDLCKGSGRSIENFHLFDALEDCKESLESFGGHAHAAGLLIYKNNIDDFRKSINKLAHERLNIDDLLPGIDVDMELRLADVSEDLAKECELLEPFGMANPEPLFYSRNLKLKGQAQSLGRETLKFWVTDGVATMQVIGFGMSSLRQDLLNAQSIDLVYTLRLDNWQGASSLILEAKEIFFK
jgi:single-stranded-DNA-specific exonuclease